jgi:hypothetical protein
MFIGILLKIFFSSSIFDNENSFDLDFYVDVGWIEVLMMIV